MAGGRRSAGTSRRDALVETIEPLTKLADADKARALLERLAEEIQPLLHARGYRVKRLVEMCCCEQRNMGTKLEVGGWCRARGDKKTAHAIALRLRHPKSHDFFSEDRLRAVLVHELTHITHGAHSASFYNLMAELEAHLKLIGRKHGQAVGADGFPVDGGARLGGPGSRVSAAEGRRRGLAAALKRRRVQETLVGGGGRALGGGIAAAPELSPAAQAARAAELRALDKKAGLGSDAELVAEHSIWCPTCGPVCLEPAKHAASHVIDLSAETDATDDSSEDDSDDDVVVVKRTRTGGHGGSPPSSKAVKPPQKTQAPPPPPPPPEEKKKKQEVAPAAPGRPPQKKGSPAGTTTATTTSGDKKKPVVKAEAPAPVCRAAPPPNAAQTPIDLTASDDEDAAPPRVAAVPPLRSGLLEWSCASCPSCVLASAAAPRCKACVPVPNTSRDAEIARQLEAEEKRAADSSADAEIARRLEADERRAADASRDAEIARALAREEEASMILRGLVAGGLTAEAAAPGRFAPSSSQPRPPADGVPAFDPCKSSLNGIQDFRKVSKTEPSRGGRRPGK